MKNELFPAIKLTVLTLLLLSGLYTLAILGVAQFAPAQGKGETIYANGRIVGFQKVGQAFTQDAFFWSRPSAVAYNAAGSGGSNKGPTNPDYLATVQARIDTFAVHHPYLQKSAIPAEMVTASGSGLDPNISPQAAAVQIQRVARARGLDIAKVADLVQKHTTMPLLGAFGTPVVNVLELNIALTQ